MLGWDVGYVWPLLEGVVVVQEAQSVDPQQIVMGYPRETTSTQTEHASPSRGGRPPPPRPQISTVTGTNGTDPPSYESIAVPSFPLYTSLPQRHQETTRHSRPDSEADSSESTSRSVTDIRQSRQPRWPHNTSSTFACVCCVLGMYNISRFSLLVYIYKASFILEFILLSAVVGIPLLYLQMVLGQYLGAGLLNMWYISPAFKGLGFALLYIYLIIGVYSAVPLSWMFVYFKDSFITLKDSYKWGRCHPNFARNDCLKALNSSAADYYGWSVPSYFHGRVLGRRPGEYYFGELKFEVAFNLCLVWLIIFVCLSRGPKTLGKVVYIIGTLPVVLLIMITMRMGQQWGEGIKDLFTSPWRPVLADSSTWLLAAREVFLTWGLLGSVALHICSHNKISTNVTRMLAVVVFTTFVVLILASFLFACSAHVLVMRNLAVGGSSYEEESSVRVLRSGSSYYKNMTVAIMVLGEGIVPREKLPHLSGYQVLRLATEVFPSALAIEGVRSISSFWSICFYTAMIMFGLGQQAVLWYCVVESIVSINYKVFKTWHTTLTFIACNLAFLLGLSLTSNVGIHIIYYFDFCVGTLWWIVIIYLIMLFAVLFIRGRPCGTDQLVKLIICPNSPARSWLLPFLTFQWNILLPFALLVFMIAFLRSSPMNPTSILGLLKGRYGYWPEWAKTLMFCVQVFPLMITLTVCAYQLFKVFVAKADLPMSERLRHLCCPVLPPPSQTSRQSLRSTSSIGQGSTNSAFIDDPPPKYTPPPSYSTATSRMLAKRLQSTSTCSVDLESLEGDTRNGAEKQSNCLRQDSTVTGLLESQSNNSRSRNT